MSDSFDRALDDVVKDNFSKKNAARRNQTNTRTGINQGYNNRGTGKFVNNRGGANNFRRPMNNYHQNNNYNAGGPIRNGRNFNPNYRSSTPYSRGAGRGMGRGMGRGNFQLNQHVRSNQNFNTVQAHVTSAPVADNVLTRVLISNLDPNSVSLDDVKELYGEFGSYRRMVLNYDKAGRSLGTAEIVYENRKDALRAMQTYNGVPLDGKTMCVEVVSNNLSQVRQPVVGSNRLGQPNRPMMRGNFRGRGVYWGKVELILNFWADIAWKIAHISLKSFPSEPRQFSHRFTSR